VNESLGFAHALGSLPVGPQGTLVSFDVVSHFTRLPIRQALNLLSLKSLLTFPDFFLLLRRPVLRTHRWRGNGVVILTVYSLLFYPEDGGNTFPQNVGKIYQTTRCHIPEDRTPIFKIYIVNIPIILSRVQGCVTIDGVWIYRPLVYITRNYTLQVTDTHRLVSSVYYSLH
jgi:hypothetical protein